MIYLFPFLHPVLHQLLRCQRQCFISPLPNPALDTHELICSETQDNSITLRAWIFFVFGDCLVFAPDFVLSVARGVAVKMDFVIKVFIIAHTAEGASCHFSKIVIGWKAENIICNFELFNFFQGISAWGVFHNIKTT